MKLGQILRTLILGLCAILASAGAGEAATVADLWKGQAHFSEIGELNWEASSSEPREQAGWFAARGGTWYVFNRIPLDNAPSYCPRNYAGLVVRQSKDRGAHWSKPVAAVNPGASKSGDGCAIIDTGGYYDTGTKTWHLLAQCIDKNDVGGWSVCHYTRRAPSPLGPFQPDPVNPVIRGGQLWSKICAGAGKACPVTTLDEGTPDISGKRNGVFTVTMHGFDPVSLQGFRGVVGTRDFAHWQISGGGLPDDATLGPADCRAWLKDCVGAGAATSLTEGKFHYLVVETMTKSLVCVPGQDWVFQLLRARRDTWPRSGSGGWTNLLGHALLRSSYPGQPTACALQYAKWLVDGSNIYLIYEDFGPKHASVRRRVLQLQPGPGAPLRIKP